MVGGAAGCLHDSDDNDASNDRGDGRHIVVPLRQALVQLADEIATNGSDWQILPVQHGLFQSTAEGSCPDFQKFAHAQTENTRRLGEDHCGGKGQTIAGGIGIVRNFDQLNPISVTSLQSLSEYQPALDFRSTPLNASTPTRSGGKFHYNNNFRLIIIIVELSTADNQPVCLGTPCARGATDNQSAASLARCLT